MNLVEASLPFGDIDYLAGLPRDYSPVYGDLGLIREDETHDEPYLQLFRRTGSPEIPQVARAYRGLSAGVSTTELFPSYLVNRRSELLKQVDRSAREVEAHPNLMGSTVPAADILHAVLLSSIDLARPAWLSTTHSSDQAEKLWKHLPMITINVPVDKVMPVSLLAEAYYEVIGEPRPLSPHETGVLGGVDPTWVVQ